MAKKSDLKVGQRVKFHPTHNKALELTGAITAIAEANDIVEIEAEPDGKVIEVAVNFSAHSDDVTPISEPAKAEEVPAEEASTEKAPARRLHRAS